MTLILFVLFLLTIYASLVTLEIKITSSYESLEAWNWKPLLIFYVNLVHQSPDVSKKQKRREAHPVRGAPPPRSCRSSARCDSARTSWRDTCPRCRSHASIWCTSSKGWWGCWRYVKVFFNIILFVTSIILGHFVKLGNASCCKLNVIFFLAINYICFSVLLRRCAEFNF